MRISDENLEEGRQLLRARDLDGFLSWYHRHYPLGDTKLMRSYMHLSLIKGNALEAFELHVATREPDKELFHFWAKVVGVIVVALICVTGVVGGIVYLAAYLLGG